MTLPQFMACLTPEVFNSVWRVADAINACPQLQFRHPEDYDDQRRIAAGFARKSQAGFQCCAGAIDGMLLWTEKPSDLDCLLAKCGAGKFFCGRKSKFGLNLQGTCDSDGKFLDVSIAHPGSTSDCLSFCASPLCCKLDGSSQRSDEVDMPENPKRSFLAPGLCLFGDNAYVNTPHMATPHKGVRSGPRDSYNFYHSQLRIKIECAFGMLANNFLFFAEPSLLQLD